MSSPSESDAISLAELSATHRDMLWVLSQTAPSENGQLHHILTDYYADSIDQTQVCDILEEPIKRDLVTKQSHDTTEYRLTESRWCWSSCRSVEGRMYVPTSPDFSIFDIDDDQSRSA